MSMSHCEGDNGLSLTERHLFSLFARYPEITFDPENRIPEKEQDRPKHPTDEFNSSPISTLAEEGDRSLLSNSTAQTTPLRPLLFLQPPTPISTTDTVAGYLRQVQQTDLSTECRLFFTTLAQTVGAISAGIVPSTNGRYRINNTFFMDQCSNLLRDGRVLLSQTKEQVGQLSSLKNLVLFRAVPPDSMLWAAYRQRAQMIIRLTAIPSPVELVLIHNLARLYNTCVYQPVQTLYDDDEIEQPTIRVLNELYDLLFSWFAEYRQWCDAMTDLKECYMATLVARMMASPTLLADIKEMQRAKEKAETALRDPVGPSMLPMDERVLKALNLSARRKDILAKRTKTRFRREKTI